MSTGKVKWFSTEKNFGFIVPDDGGPDIFVHVSSVPQGEALQADDKVSYEAAQRKGKSCAINVQLF
jgi:CspA family cold shock protein